MTKQQICNIFAADEEKCYSDGGSHVSCSDGEKQESEEIPVIKISSKTIHIQKTRKNSKGNLSNKEHACVYCKEFRQNIARHLTRKHGEELEVGKILALPKKSKERRKLWEQLVNKGDFANNYSVLEKGHGCVIPKYHIWSKEEKDALEIFFEKHLRLMKVPGKLDCLNAQRSHPCLLNISWKKIKYAVYNTIKSKMH